MDVGRYILTSYRQVSEEIGVYDWAFALGAAGGGRGAEYAERWDTSVGRNQNPIRILPAEHPSESSTGAWFSESSTIWKVSVDFREDPGAGITASIQFTKTDIPVVSGPRTDSFRLEDMPSNEASGLNFNLEGLNSKKLSALGSEPRSQWRQTGDLRYLQIVWTAEAEEQRRAEEEKRKQEQAKKSH